MSKLAVVTGGNGGLGTAICRALADQGRQVIAAYYPSQEEQAWAWQKAQQQDGYEFLIEPVDVSCADSCRAFYDRVHTRHGAVSILVNNAGITRDGVLRKMSADQWNQVIETNLSGVFNMTQPLFAALCEQGWGRIVNISSVNGEKGQFGQANYSAAKAGVHGFTMAVAQEGARKGITVNTVSPGYVATEMVMAMPEEPRRAIEATIPIGRLGLPEEIGRAVAFLTDDQASYVTGCNLSVNGGLYMGF